MKFYAGIFAAIVLAIAAWFLWDKYGSHDSPLPPAPPAGNVTSATGKPITHGDPSLPQPDKHTTGVQRITVPPSSVPREIFLYIQDDPKTPPVVRADGPVSTTFHAVVDPWLKFQVQLAIGISLDNDADVSPWGGVHLVTLFRRVDLGAGVDEDGIGVFASYRIWREFELGAMWYALPVFDSDARCAITISYRF